MTKNLLEVDEEKFYHAEPFFLMQFLCSFPGKVSIFIVKVMFNSVFLGSNHYGKIIKSKKIKLFRHFLLFYKNM